MFVKCDIFNETVDCLKMRCLREFIRQKINCLALSRVHNRFGGMRDWAIFRGDARDGG